ncbi:MAG: RluA family pseudouridine synthase [Bacteroidetes bacterium]|nr:RluA family pseudouridine synthase [Bacteroidota bacterium]MBL6944620.1 RluA family pseudouridine synthase [Bacteroidales bacterium]
MLIIQHHTVSKKIARLRLLDYALEVFTTVPSRASMKKVIKRGELLVNNQPGHQSNWVEEGQEITLIDLELKPPKPLVYKLEVVFEDEHLAIINKPAGIEVSGNKYYTIQNALMTNINPSKESDALKWPRPVHRLDVPTSGLLLVAKTALAVMTLGQRLEKREVKKRYRAIVAGKPPDSGEINTAINGQEAYTKYKVVSRCHSLKTQWLSLVDLFPLTGRTHQLRIHMAEIGFPIVGDQHYGSGPLLRGKGLFLSAVGLRFLHPIKKQQIDINILQPNKFDLLLVREERRWKSYNIDENK